MFLDQGPSWRQRSQPQPVNQEEGLSEQGSWYGHLCQRKGDVAAMADDLGPDLDQLLP